MKAEVENDGRQLTAFSAPESPSWIMGKGRAEKDAMGRGKRGRRKRGTEGKKSGVPPNCSSYPQEIDTEFD